MINIPINNEISNGSFSVLLLNPYFNDKMNIDIIITTTIMDRTLHNSG